MHKIHVTKHYRKAVTKIINLSNAVLASEEQKTEAQRTNFK